MMEIPPDYTPKTNAAEWHLTYRCNLACIGCNRLSFLPPSTPDMTPTDAWMFVEQAQKRNWSPYIYLLGGEPTLHDQLFEFIDIACELSPGRVMVVSNGYSQRTKETLMKVVQEGKANMAGYSLKPNGSVVHPVRDYHVAPADFGVTRSPCIIHSSGRTSCGISVDAAGYTVCAVGGAIDGMLGLGLRTKRLSDLFTPDFARRQTEALCGRCGANGGVGLEIVDKCQQCCGVRMSSTWAIATRKVTKND